MKTYVTPFNKNAGLFVFCALAILLATWGFSQTTNHNSHKQPQKSEKPPRPIVSRDPVVINAANMIEDGRQIFRFDTYGDEAFWGDTLRLHEAIEGSTLGGTGPGLSPSNALALGLKVDADALPAKVLTRIKRGTLDLGDPAVTLALIKSNAVLGVKGTFNPDGSLKSIGLTCAVCHSTVNDSVAPGIGKRLDGWANRDLNSGAIIALAPNLKPLIDLLSIAIPGITDDQVRAVLNSWGPGKFDAELILDGKAFQPDGRSAATLIPNAYGLAGFNLHTWTGGWGTVTYWNAFVAVLELHGVGTFFDERLDDKVLLIFDQLTSKFGWHIQNCQTWIMAPGLSA